MAEPFKYDIAFSFLARDHLTEDEIARLLDALSRNRHGKRDRLIGLLIYRHGLQVSEACDLRWDDLDFTKRTIEVCGSTVVMTVVITWNAIVRRRWWINVASAVSFGSRARKKSDDLTTAINLAAKLSRFTGQFMRFSLGPSW
jgi:integrase